MALHSAFEQPAEEESHRLPAARLRRRQQRPLITPPAPVVSSRLLVTHSFTLPVGRVCLAGELALPQQSTGLILVAPGSGGSRLSWRSRHLSRLLQQASLSTLCLDLLTPQEERQRHLAQPDVALLTERLVQSIMWTQRQPNLLGLRLGLLGEDATALASLAACSQLGSLVGGIVCLGSHSAPEAPVAAPTLLLVGDQDAAGLQTSVQAQRTLGASSQVRTIASAGRLFQEPGTLVQAMQHAAAWFNKYLAKPRKL